MLAKQDLRFPIVACQPSVARSDRRGGPSAYYIGALSRVTRHLLKLCREEGVRFYTKQKSIMQRWPASIGKGAEFVMPTAK